MDSVQYENWVIQQLLETQSNPNCAMPEIDLRASLSENFGVSLDRAYRIIRQIVEHNSRVSLEKWTDKEFAVLYH